MVARNKMNSKTTKNRKNTRTTRANKRNKRGAKIKGLKPERKPERQSQRIKNQKLGIKLPKIDFDKLDTQLVVNVTNDKNPPQKPQLLSKASTSSDVVEKQRKYYNQIAVDDTFKNQLQANSGYAKDKFGNWAGNKFDLAMDLGFKGRLIAVLHLYTGEGFDFSLPGKALKEKGFDIHRWTTAPPINEFKEILEKSCQLWLISNSYPMLGDEHLELIQRFFDSGRGVYIWGENHPFYADANIVSMKLFNAKMSGDVHGGKVCQLQKEDKKAGLLPNHLISTGIDNLFEGITIATIDDNPDLEPLFYGSANNLVIAVYDKYGKRAIIDGGYTRLFLQWDTAGTGRYVKNAAAFLANIENFG